MSKLAAARARAATGLELARREFGLVRRSSLAWIALVVGLLGGFVLIRADSGSKGVEWGVLALEIAFASSLIALLGHRAAERSQAERERVQAERDEEKDLRLAALVVAATQDLRGANFAHLDLTHLPLAGKNLGRANLSGAVLRGADLTDTDFTSAVLIGADLSEAILTGAKFDGAILAGAVLRGVRTNYPGEWSDSDGRCAGDLISFARASMSAVDLTDARLQWADFDRVDLCGAQLDNTRIRGGSMKAIRFGEEIGSTEASALLFHMQRCGIEPADVHHEVIGRDPTGELLCLGMRTLPTSTDGLDLEAVDCDQGFRELIDVQPGLPGPAQEMA